MHSGLPIVISWLLVCGCSTSSPEASEPIEQPVPVEARTPGAPLVFEPPSSWVVETPSSSMRKAQYRLPRVAGDEKDAECVVYYFGAQGGGGLEANIERWCSQFQQLDGRDSNDVLERTERTVADMPVHEVRLSGTYVAETAPGSGVRVNEPGFRMLAAILESDHGAYYAKVVGPEATVRSHTAAFDEFISGVR